MRSHPKACWTAVFLTALLVFAAFSDTAFVQEYVIGPGDVLAINVYEHPDLTTEIQVDDNGAIRFPLIGELNVSGMSVSGLSETIEQRLADGYIINPQVSIIVKEYRNRKATILGQVKSPGLYELKGVTTLLELISRAGGLTEDAGQYAYITRAIAAKDGPGRAGDDGGKDIINKDIIKIDLKKLVEEGSTEGNVTIENGDSVFISKMEKVYVTGEVTYPGAYPYERGLTVIKAITNARGFTDKASTTGVKIIRKENGKERVIEKVNMDDLVQPDDVIVVPQSFF